MPQFRYRGHNATLLCKYELEDNEELFSLKWYKEETEFYRYVCCEGGEGKCLCSGLKQGHHFQVA